jgi:hypothetical protein
LWHSALRSTLLKIVGNLVDKPEERKFRCLRKAGAAFHEALGKLTGGHDALRAIGFRDATEPNGDEVHLHSLCPLLLWSCLCCGAYRTGSLVHSMQVLSMRACMPAAGVGRGARALGPAAPEAAPAGRAAGHDCRAGAAGVAHDA